MSHNGVLVDSLNWRWVFLVNIPVGVIAFGYGLVFLRDSDKPTAGRFDVGGFLLSGRTALGISSS
jgi:hypothetical protein